MPAANQDKSIFIKYWLPVIIYAIIIFLASSIPGQKIPLLFNLQDVVFHIVEFGIFAILLNRAIRATNPEKVVARRFLWVLFIAVIYAISDELHQAFVPNRSASVYDVAYDSIGIFIARIFYR